MTSYIKYVMDEYSEGEEPKSARNYFFFRFDEEKTLGNLRFADMLKALQIKHLTELILYKCLSCIDGISEKTRIWAWFLSILSAELGFHRRTCNIYPAMLGTYLYAVTRQD